MACPQLPSQLHHHSVPNFVSTLFWSRFLATNTTCYAYSNFTSSKRFSFAGHPLISSQYQNESTVLAMDFSMDLSSYLRWILPTSRPVAFKSVSYGLVTIKNYPWFLICWANYGCFQLDSYYDLSLGSSHRIRDEDGFRFWYDHHGGLNPGWDRGRRHVYLLWWGLMVF